MDISIAIVSHNHKALIEKYFKHLLDTLGNINHEIALIDNTCKDGLAEWMNEAYSSVKVVKNEREKSYAENINYALELMPGGRYFAIINPDVKCLPGIWEELIEFMAHNPDVGIAGPKLLNPDLTLQPSCRRFSTPLNLLIRGMRLDGMFRNTRFMRAYLMQDYDHEWPLDVDWITGAFMLVRREAIAEVGGMDEEYKIAYSEDQDWCCRMWRAGWRVAYVPSAVAIHDHLRTGIKKPWSKMARAQLINAVRMFHKFNWKLSRS